jgi:hypothetical protein
MLPAINNTSSIQGRLLDIVLSMAVSVPDSKHAYGHLNPSTHRVGFSQQTVPCGHRTIAHDIGSGFMTWASERLGANEGRATSARSTMDIATNLLMFFAMRKLLSENLDVGNLTLSFGVHEVRYNIRNIRVWGRNHPQAGAESPDFCLESHFSTATNNYLTSMSACYSM